MLAIAERIERLHRDFGQEPVVRERLATALYNATVVEPDAARMLAIAERIERLHRDFGEEPVVREQLAKALYNATVGEPDAAGCWRSPSGSSGCIVTSARNRWYESNWQKRSITRLS